MGAVDGGKEAQHVVSKVLVWTHFDMTPSLTEGSKVYSISLTPFKLYAALHMICFLISMSV